MQCLLVRYYILLLYYIYIIYGGQRKNQWFLNESELSLLCDIFEVVNHAVANGDVKLTASFKWSLICSTFLGTINRLNFTP